MRFSADKQYMPSAKSIKLITWSDRYSVGNARIDAEHQTLVGLINDLYAAIRAGKPDSATAKVLNGLAVYTLSHFGTEERLLKKCAYPGYSRHKAEHDKMVAQVKELQQELRSGKGDISQELLTFLHGWLVGHILVMDKEYSSHLRAAGIR